MKRRITFVQRIDAGFNPQQAVLTTSSLSVRDLDAARQDRITVGLNELPEEVRRTRNTELPREVSDAELNLLVTSCLRAIP
jgi:hypothetical protein